MFDGPDFDGHLVDYENLLKRNQMYKDKRIKRLYRCYKSRGEKHE